MVKGNKCRLKITTRWCTSLFLAGTIFLSNVVLAANPANITIINCDDVNRIVTIRGNIDTTMENEDVVLSILAKDMVQSDFENTTPENVASVLSYFAQKPLGADGSFEFVFKLKGEDGSYIVLIDSKALDSTYSATIDFENTLWTELKDLKDDTAEGALESFKSFIEGEFISLGVDPSEYNQLDATAKTAVATALKTFAEDYSKDNFAPEWDKNVIWTFIDANRNNLSAVAEMVGEKYKSGNSAFDTSWMNFYLENYSDDAQQLICSKVIENPECDTLDEFISGMNNELVIAYVETTDYWKDLYTIIEAENNVLGFNSSSLTTFGTLINKDAVVSNLYNGSQSFTTSAQVISLFDTLVASQKSAESRPQINNNNNNSVGSMGIAPAIKPVQPENKPQPTTPPEEDVETPTLSFSDIADVEWAIESIECLSERGILSGVGDGRFEPNRYMTREELIKMLDNAFGYSKDAAECDFKDADKDAWYYTAVAGAVNKGIINGYEDNTFGIGEYITRQDTAVILLRVAGIESFSKKEAIEFTDNEDISDYAKEAVELLSGCGIISGMGNGIFAPMGNLTRAQAAKLFHGLLMHIEE